MTKSRDVVDNAAERRFEIDLEGTHAIADYAIHAGTITFTHTFVPEHLRGQGLATRLVEAALDSARARGLKVVPQCAMFADYMQSHPAVHDLLA